MLILCLDHMSMIWEYKAGLGTINQAAGKTLAFITALEAWGMAGLPPCD